MIHSRDHQRDAHWDQAASKDHMSSQQALSKNTSPVMEHGDFLGIEWNVLIVIAHAQIHSKKILFQVQQKKYNNQQRETECSGLTDYGLSIWTVTEGRIGVGGATKRR